MKNRNLDYIIKHIQKYGKFNSLNQLKKSIVEHKVCSHQTVQNLKEELIDSPNIKYTKTQDGEVFEYCVVANISEIEIFFGQGNSMLDSIQKQLKELLKNKGLVINENKNDDFPNPYSPTTSLDIFVKSLKNLEYFDTTARYYYNTKQIPKIYENQFKKFIIRISGLKNDVYTISHKVKPDNTRVIHSIYTMMKDTIYQKE